MNAPHLGCVAAVAGLLLLAALALPVAPARAATISAPVNRYAYGANIFVARHSDGRLQSTTNPALTATGYGLHRSPSLSPVAWGSVTNPPTEDGGTKSVTLLVEQGPEFFRLHKS